jgi:hypothetical protein
MLFSNKFTSYTRIRGLLLTNLKLLELVTLQYSVSANFDTNAIIEHICHVWGTFEGGI